MPVKKLQTNTASEAVHVAEELMDYAMFTGNERWSDIRQFTLNVYTKI